MTSLASRVSLIEVALDRLVSRRGFKVGEALHAAWRRAKEGKLPAPVVHDVEQLQRDARGSGLKAELAQAHLRAMRPRLQGALLPPQDGRGEGGTGNPAANAPTRSTGTPGSPASIAPEAAGVQATCQAIGSRSNSGFNL